MTPPTETRRFPFRFDRRFALVGRPLGVHDGSTWVEVGPTHLEARFGRWHVWTPLSNVTGVEISGPYALHRTIGPAHLSFTDKGLTFATNPDRGVCLTFREPVRGIDPLGLIRHPGLTLTVADPDGLAELLRDAGTARSDLDEQRTEQAAEDHLHTMTSAELRALADERGVDRKGASSHAELVALLEDDLGDDLVDELGPEVTAS